MKSKICGFILFMLLAAGTAFGQTKELTCTNQGSGKEAQLTLDYDKHTAFFHDGAGDAPTSAEFTADTISWEASWKAWQGHKQVTATCDYVLNRNTGSLHVGRGEGGRYSCSVSDKKF